MSVQYAAGPQQGRESSREALPPSTEPGRTLSYSPSFINRTAGLPYSAVSGLESPRSAEWAARTLTSRRRLQDLSVVLSDEISELIGDNEDRKSRQYLLALRRNIFNLRIPADVEEAVERIGSYDARIAERFRAWSDQCLAHNELVHEGDAHLTADRSNTREYLGGLSSSETLRRGIALASPALHAQLSQNFPQATLKAQTKSIRKLERSLLHYVYRTACKTSPFSTLTTVSRGIFDSGPDSGAREAIIACGDVSKTLSASRLNVAILPRITTALIQNPEYRRSLPVELVSGWRIRSQRLRYMRRRRVVGASDSKVTMDSMQENVFYLNTGEIMSGFASILNECPGISYTELIERMHRQVPIATDDDIEHFMESVIRLDLITVPALAIDIHADEPFLAYAQKLREINTEWSGPLAREIEEAVAAAHRLGDTDQHLRPQLDNEIRSRLSSAVARIGVDEASVPRTLLYEDVATRAYVRASLEQWQTKFSPNLEQLASILPVFDILLPQHHLLKGFFTVRFGQGGVCTDLLKFVQDFHLDIFDEYMKTVMGPPLTGADGLPAAPPNWLDLPETDALHKARLALIRGMRERFGALKDVHEELVLDDEFFTDIRRELPSGSQDPAPQSFFGQVYFDDDEPRLMVNKSYSGLSLLFSRFVHCLSAPGLYPEEIPDLADQLRTELQNHEPENAVFAEMTGGVDTTNLNLHPFVTRYEIVAPGETSVRPLAEQIPTSDLEIRHQQDTNQIILWSRTLDRRVIPLYLGFLMPFVLSPAQRVLLLFSFSKIAQMDFWTGTDTPLGDKVCSSHPRVRLGDVVLVRETWKTNPAKLPQRSAHVSEAQWYLAWQDFRLEYELPRFVFATLSTGPQVQEANEEGIGAERTGGSAKPQYIDFHSESCLLLLDDMIRQGSDRLVFNEMLPGPDQLWLRQGEHTYVTEQTFEVIIKNTRSEHGR